MGTMGRIRSAASSRWLWILVFVVLWASAAQIDHAIRDHGWVTAGTLNSVDQRAVIYIASLKVFVVANDSHPVGLSAVSPHVGEPVLFCQDAGYFQDIVGGDRFDRFGTYATGPAPRSLDRVAVKIEGGEVQVNPDLVSKGLARGTRRPLSPTGPFCPDAKGSSRPGFMAPPTP
jgi:hypothetical protein